MEYFNQKCMLMLSLGLSDLGLLTTPTLPAFINGPILQNSGWPWGYRNVSNTDPYDESQIPYTGMTRYYSWTITNTTLAPDGVKTPVVCQSTSDSRVMLMMAARREWSISWPSD